MQRQPQSRRAQAPRRRAAKVFLIARATPPRPPGFLAAITISMIWPGPGEAAAHYMVSGRSSPKRAAAGPRLPGTAAGSM
jgi:hypothetical protein